MKPQGWPRYVVERRLAGGIGYFWQPPARDRKAGFALRPEPLGGDYAKAKARADVLNAELDAWRRGRGGEKAMQGVGTVRWWFHVYRTESLSWRENLTDRTRAEYARHMRIIEALPLERRRKGLETVGDLPLASITEAAADRLYARLRVRADGASRLRQAHFELDIMRRAWSVVARMYPEAFPRSPQGTVLEPFRGVERLRSQKAVKPAATVEEAYALANALRSLGHPHLGAAALIAFEWLQRPENILEGWIRWTDYRPGKSVMIYHHKTGERVEHALSDADGAPFYPEIEAYLTELDPLGVSIVLRRQQRGALKGQGTPYTRHAAAELVRRARAAAGLPDHVTLDACRHGGLTELGDAGATESEGMATSAHSTPSAYRGYVKKTRTQRLSAARKRRAWRSLSG